MAVQPNPIAPNATTLDNNKPNSNPTKNNNGGTTVNQSTGQMIQTSAAQQAGTNGQNFAQQTNQGGSLNINQLENPLNIYANYTYHIRFSLTNESDANNQDGTYGTFNGTSKTIIAESGVTAAFNITNFEFVNACAPGPKHLNTTNTTWSMTIVEPYGLSLIQRIISTQKVQIWHRAPYFIEVWFNGYNVDGTLMAPTLFYTLYRVLIMDIGIKTTEGGSTYELSGVFDGDIGHSNEISIPQAKFQINTGSGNLYSFFTNFATQLNKQASTINFGLDSTAQSGSQQSQQPNVTSALIAYDFNLPTSMWNWKFNTALLDEKSQRSVDMIITPEGAGITTISIGKGASIENIINAVLATCPDVFTNWIGTNADQNPIIQTGLSIWAMIHSQIILGDINDDRNDYNRAVIYNIIPHQSIIVPTPPNIVNALQGSEAQSKKFNTLSSSGALVKVYNYIYTGLNTEVINLDINIDTHFQLSQPQWLALNTYHNFTQGPLYANSPADQVAQTGQLTAKKSANSPNTQSGGGSGSGSGTTYLEDIQLDSNQSVFTLVTRPSNLPTAQKTDVLSDATKAPNVQSSDQIPDARPYAGDYLQNLFSNNPSFMNVDIEIRGDPYWMGNGNVVDTNSLQNSNGTFTPASSASGDQRAPFLFSSTMFILSFRTGENYNTSTGLMQFDNTSFVYNGAYSVYEVTNTFKNGSFTQKLSSYKDIFSQSATSAVPSQNSGGLDPTGGV
jgi:hypothetical protein